ncbi:MAG: hypothetical protein IPL39_15445 [Opitutaceae bacterium]|nr:hypothetical protein [Opitutaceae bacterium]
MLRRLPFLLASLLLLAATTHRGAEAPSFRTLSGELEGARWTALVPDAWDGRLLLEAPDCLRAPEPLAAVLNAAAPVTSELLANGWAVATTSYRRHGPLIADGITDLRSLREHLAAELGQPTLTLIEGTGMGGLIAIFIAERHADEFHGCLALAPQLDLRDPRALRLRCDHQPRAPLLLLSPPGTVEPVQTYIARARATANAESVVPVFWFAPAEPTPADAAAQRLAALAAMEEWARNRKAPEERPVPPPSPEPEPTAAPADAETPVSEAAPEGSPPVEALGAATTAAPESAP